MDIHHITLNNTAPAVPASNRVSITTNIASDGRRSYTVQFTDGITYTARTGRSLIISTIRAYIQHRMNQRNATPSGRIIRFRRRVDGMEGGAL